MSTAFSLLSGLLKLIKSAPDAVVAVRQQDLEGWLLPIGAFLFVCTVIYVILNHRGPWDLLTRRLWGWGGGESPACAC